MIRYHLSNMQRKELLVRGRSLLIAIPTPLTKQSPLDFARSVFEPDIAEMVEKAEEIEIRVAAPLRQTSASNLTAILGAIVERETPTPIFSTEMIVIEVQISPRNCRGEVKKLQWPKSVEFFGMEIPSIDCSTKQNH